MSAGKTRVRARVKLACARLKLACARVKLACARVKLACVCPLFGVHNWYTVEPRYSAVVEVRGHCVIDEARYIAHELFRNIRSQYSSHSVLAQYCEEYWKRAAQATIFSDGSLS